MQMADGKGQHKAKTELRDARQAYEVFNVCLCRTRNLSFKIQNIHHYPCMRRDWSRRGFHLDFCGEGSPKNDSTWPHTNWSQVLCFVWGRTCIAYLDRFPSICLNSCHDHLNPCTPRGDHFQAINLPCMIDLAYKLLHGRMYRQEREKAHRTERPLFLSIGITACNYMPPKSEKDSQ